VGKVCRASVGAILCPAGGTGGTALADGPAYLLSALVFLGWPLSPRVGVTAKAPSLAQLVRGWYRNSGRAGVVVGFYRLPLLIPVFRFPIRPVRLGSGP
jgi:hypothetical protein